MEKYPQAELEPRDVVARAVLQEMLREECDHVFLDLRHLDPDLVLRRFPTIAATCREYGIEIPRDLIPVTPAAHYFMGGVAVDLDARTTVPGLWAIGEVACTGVHGANRLASNSLLEGVVYASRAAHAITADLAQPATPAAWPANPPFVGTLLPNDAISDSQACDPQVRPTIQTIMWERAGLYRDEQGLARGADLLHELAENASNHMSVHSSTSALETANMLLVAQLIVASAQARHESRGAHARRDYPTPQPFLAGQHFFTAGAAMRPFRLTQSVALANQPREVQR